MISYYENMATGKPSVKMTSDVEKMAAGVLKMIENHPHGSCLRLGMFPADIMESFEKSLKERIPDNRESDGGAHTGGKEIRREVSRAVTSRILHLATERGICRV